MEESKECFVCHKIKPLSEFYKCKGMKDGHYGKCKACYKDYARKYRKKNIEHIREYDRNRGHLGKRKKLRAATTRRRRKEVVGYQQSHSKVANAIRTGALKRPLYCECCGKIGRVEAHHENYNRPLEVIWLCPVCHRNYHMGKTIDALKVRNKVALLRKSFFNRSELTLG